MTQEISALSSGKFIATESGLVVKGSPTFDEWMAYGQMLHRINRALQMVIGDWLNEGEKRYNEIYSQATALWPEMQLDTLRNWKWVAGRVDSSLRNDTLHYSHYAAVAPLPEAERAPWLKVATEKKLTSLELRKAIQGQPPPPDRETTLHQDLLEVADELDDLVAREDMPKAVSKFLQEAVDAMAKALSALEGEKKAKAK